MPTVSITRLRVRSWRYLAAFLLYAVRSVRQARKAGGCLAVRLLRDRRKTFWTATVWSTEAAIKKFMLSGVHGTAMRKLPKWCDEASLTHWAQEGSDPPAWREAWERLQRDGRRSKVNNPSEAHISFAIPEPHVGPTSEIS